MRAHVPVCARVLLCTHVCLCVHAYVNVHLYVYFHVAKLVCSHVVCNMCVQWCERVHEYMCVSKAFPILPLRISWSMPMPVGQRTKPKPVPRGDLHSKRQTDRQEMTE